MSSCACLVELPDNVKLQFDERKQQCVDLENRECHRIGALCEGILQITSIPRALQLAGENWVAESGGTVVKDISRTGIGVYYHQQLFPRQTFVVEVQGRKISAVVVRCRYIKKRCFEIGAIIQTVQSCRG
jgi:hypothetical protein